MKNQIKNIIYKKSFIFTVLALFLIGGAFYWFAYRPAQIRHNCSWVKWIDSETLQTKYSEVYDKDEYNFCIHEKGLK